MVRLIIYLSLLLVVSSIAVSGAEELQDLSKHPLYSKYKFGRGAKVIDFGTQPLAIPVGVISEIIKRDRVLARSLKEKGWEMLFHPFLKGSDINYFLERGKIQNAPIELSIRQIAGIAKNDILKIAPLPAVPEKEYAAGGAVYRAFEFLKKQGKIPASAGWDKVFRSFDRDIINKVTADPERYRLQKFDYEN